MLVEILGALLEDLREYGVLDLSECFIDGTFVSAKKGEDQWERLNGANVRSSWRWLTPLIFLSAYRRRALRLHEVTLVEATLAANCAREEPERLVGDRAYDSDPLDEALAKRGIEMIALH